MQQRILPQIDCKMKQLFLLLLTVGSLAVYAADERNSVTAVLKTATVYATGAELQHNAVAQLRQGASELVVQGVSSYVDINSIQVNCPANVTILGLEFSNNYLQTDVAMPAVKKLEDSVERITADVAAVDVGIATTAELLQVLKANQDIKGAQTGLSVAELMKLMDYYKKKSTELQQEMAALQDRKKKLQAIQTKLAKQIAEEQKKNTQSGGRIILQLSAAMAGRYDFTITYITQNAYWTPYYDVRVDDIKNPAQLIYKAKIVQTTGIDWKQVKLSLSTSAPTQYGTAPVLRSWFLSYIDPIRSMDRRLATNRIQSFDEAIQGKAAGVTLSETVVTGVNVKIRGVNSMNGNGTPLYIVNGVEMPANEVSKLNPNDFKNVDVLNAANATAIYGSRGAHGAIVITLKEGLEDYVTVTDNELDVSYDIALPYDVPANGKQQIATLKETAVEAVYKYYAVPKLDKDAFLLAEISEWEKLDLLPGEANIIFEGTYIGKTFIDPANTADTLNLTMGKDKRVVVKREKLADYSSVKFLGSNKLQKLTYQITVKNNKKEPIKLLLKDQYPISTNKDIEVELLETGDAAVNAELGVLTWKLELAPGESKKLRIGYSVKYPKGKTLNLY
jgi:TonB-dependent SusC/RagA subfamily outer membrane receptor